MNPHQFSHYPRHFWHMRMHRGPSRLIWFAIGGIAATIYHRKHEQYHQGRRSCNRGIENHNANAYTPPVVGGQGHFIPAPPPNPHPSQPQHPVADYPQSAVWDSPSSKENNNWEEKRELIRQFNKEVQDTVGEFSETALDGLLVKVEGLRAKLAAHRAERDAQLKQVGTEQPTTTEEPRQDRRWV